jgi:hypothetical protein
MMFSARSMPVAVNSTIEYVMLPLHNNRTATEKLFSTRSVPRCNKQDSEGWASEKLVGELIS